ncbi:ComEA family DNA-binding protein [Pseudomonas guariconensis]|uniref:ComEA family DNA-binding protein n=1 Tax=Pseudomonas guariconensis TaxID=1288410 RepID=UPI00367121E9
MRNTILSYLLIPLFTGLCLSTTPVIAAASNEPVAIMAPTEPAVGRVDLNKADAKTLQKVLSGIGQAKAQAIVAHREDHGPFTSVDELLEIKGIGNALLERNREKLMVE